MIVENFKQLMEWKELYKHAQFKQGNEIIAVFVIDNEEMHMLTNST